MQDGHRSSDVTARPGLYVRPAGLDDYSTIRHIQSAAVRTLGERLIEAGDVASALSTIYSADYLAELMARSTFLALINDDVVGTCGWNASDDRGHAARITGLFVLPLFQSQGIGSHLLEHVEHDAGRNGYTRFNAIAPVSMRGLFTRLHYTTTSFGTSRDVVPGVAMQVAFLRKPA